MMKNRFFALLLSMVLVLGLLPANVFAKDNTVKISTPQELVAFAKECVLDSYSKGLTVEIMSELDMTGTGFSGIPSFSGTLKGNGHRIRGIAMSDAHGVTGFVRYLEKDGVIENLHISASYMSDDKDSILGGIVSVNEGLIKGCSYTGNMNGKSLMGGIAGENAASGRIENCRTLGKLIANSECGGICGKNLGTIKDCVNNAQINTDSSWLEDDDSTITTIFNTVSTVVSGNDIGGICGSNDGSILACTNKGDVGYQNEGYNMGGIAGRSNGYIEGCENQAAVMGKQDVGGIAGQFEPHLIPSQRLNLKNAMNELHDTINKTIDDIDKLGKDADGKLDELQKEADELSDAADKMSDEGTKFVNSNIDEVNRLTAMADEVADMLPTVTSSGKKAMDEAVKLVDTLDKIGETADVVNTIKKTSPGAYEQLTTDKAILSSQSAILSQSLRDASNASQDLRDQLASGSAITSDAVRNDLTVLMDATAKGADAAAQMIEAANDIYSIMSGPTSDAYHAIFDDGKLLDQANTQAKNCLTYLDKAAKGLDDIASYLEKQDAIAFTGLSKDFSKNEDQIKKNLDNISDIVRDMRGLMTSDADVLEADFKAINDQTNNVFLLLADKLDEIQGVVTGGSMLDDQSTADGRNAYYIKNCTNSGKVQGKTNIGGIAGALDVDGGVTDAASDAELSLHYYAYALLSLCENKGLVKATGNNAGGIVGNAAVGYISKNTAKASVRSTGGNYVGGIAGSSKGKIVSCYSTAEIGGNSYIGGIAGSATDVSDCYAMVYLYEDVARVGAILGIDGSDEDTTAERHRLMGSRIKNNYFVSETLNGLDGVSYKNIAEPLSYEELKTKSKSNVFDKMLVIFADEDDNILKESELDYGSAVSSLVYPSISAEDATYNQWEGLTGEIAKHGIILRVSSEDTVTVLSSGVENGKSIVLIGGSFTTEAFIEAQKLDTPFVSVGEKEFYCARKVLILGASDAATARTVRVLNETEGVNGRVYVMDETGITEVPCKAQGQYYEFEVSGNEFSYCLVTEQEGLPMMYIYIGGAAAVVVLIGAVLIVKKNKKKKEKK